jgi:hypothetical protein
MSTKQHKDLTGSDIHIVTVSGTWTPDLYFGSGKTGITYFSASQTGTYRKMDNLVFISASIILTSKGSSTGAAAIRGLPFASAYDTPVNIRLAAVSFANQHQSYINSAVNYIYLQESAEDGTVTDLDDTNFANTSRIMISGCYVSSV